MALLACSNADQLITQGVEGIASDSVSGSPRVGARFYLGHYVGLKSSRDEMSTLSDGQGRYFLEHPYSRRWIVHKSNP